MKLATWNLNSIRARTERLLAWLEREKPDVLCLQETKVEDAGFPIAALRKAGYEVATFGQRSYNGVAIASMLAPPSLAPPSVAPSRVLLPSHVRSVAPLEQH